MMHPRTLALRFLYSLIRDVFFCHSLPMGPEQQTLGHLVRSQRYRDARTRSSGITPSLHPPRRSWDTPSAYPTRPRAPAPPVSPFAAYALRRQRQLRRGVGVPDARPGGRAVVDIVASIVQTRERRPHPLRLQSRLDPVSLCDKDDYTPLHRRRTASDALAPGVKLS